MSELTVSTVIPTHKRPALLRAALTTAVRESEPGDEVIVVDDGGEAETKAVVDAFGPPVRYLTTATPHSGAGAARNVGIQAALGDLVAFLDDDDEWMPGKLGWQRAVMEAFPQVLFLFSDFGSIEASGQRVDEGGLISWREHALRPWDAILDGQNIPSRTLPGLPSSAPSFNLRTGDLYADFITDWCIFTSTLIVRKDAAGSALRFPEDLPTYEDLECYARLAQRGTAGFMDCATAWHGHQAGRHLSDATKLAKAETAMTIIDRVWGSDVKYLRDHRPDFEVVMDGHRTRKIRYLLAIGKPREARKELDAFFHRPSGYMALTWVPASLFKLAADLRQRVLRLGRRLRSRQ